MLSLVKKTKRLVVVENGWSNGSILSEIITRVMESGIKLKKTAQRICWLNNRVPISTPLEKDFYFNYKDIFKICIQMMKV